MAWSKVSRYQIRYRRNGRELMLDRPSRWAAKEAAYKALYPHYRATWKDLQLIKEGPKPALLFRPTTNADRAARSPSAATLPRLHLSISHDADLLIAYVIAERSSAPH